MKPGILENLRSNPWLHLLIGIVIIFTGIYFSDLPRMFASSGWPTTEGKIITNRIMGQKIEQYDGTFYTNFEVFIRYQYTVDGTTYSSNALNSIDASSYPASFAGRYPSGKEVTVYYNPRDPSDAVLEPGFVDVFQAFDVFSVLTFAAGIYFIYLGILGIKTNRKRNHGDISRSTVQDD